MPTSTATLTGTASMAKSPVSFKAVTTSKSTIATLRSLYPRAARAFLQRNVELTYSLLLSAFSNLDPPYSHSPDPLSSHRRKWDILRITLETTLYTSAPKEAPEGLRSDLALSPPSLLATMHTRSLKLFTPTSRGRPSSEYLPSQIIAALVLASVKLECVQVGREMVEDWLAHRNQTQHNPEKVDAKDATEGYEKVLEIYCLHILPRLEDWEYAKQFLDFEDELPGDRKTYILQSLNVLQAQHMEELEKMRENQRQSVLLPSPSSSRTPTPRPRINGRQPSPNPSSTSASSNSTRTIVPQTSRPPHVPSSLSSLTPPPSTPPRSQKLSPSTPVAQHASSPIPPFPRHISTPQMPVSSVPPPSLITLLKSSIIPHLTTSNLTFLFLMFLVPLVSFLLRLRRRRLRLWPNGGPTLSVVRPGESAAAEARKRLKVGWWAEIRKAVVDTVKMAGGGIV